MLKEKERMVKYKEPSTEKKRQLLKYPLNTKVKFNISHWVASEGVIVKYSDNSKQIVIIRDLKTLELHPRSLNHLDRFN